MRNLTVKKSNGSEEELLKLDCEEELWQMKFDLVAKLDCKEEQWQMRNLTAKKSNGSEEELSKLDCEEDQWQMRNLIWSRETSRKSKC
eukprot:2338947-Rhodomonas_salina.1